MGIIVGAVLAMIRLLLQLRCAHATLTVYSSGTACRIAYLFQDVSRRAVADAQAMMTGAAPPPKDADQQGTALGAILAFLGLSSLAQSGPAEATVQPAHKPGSIHEPGATAPPATPSSASSAAAPAPLSSTISRAGAASALVPEVPHPDAADYPAESLPGDELLPSVGVYTLHGYATYISVQAHRDRLRALFKSTSESALPGVSVVAVSLTEVYYAGAYAVATFARGRGRGGSH